MSSHESRESRSDEPLEPDRPIPPAGARPDADSAEIRGGNLPGRKRLANDRRGESAPDEDDLADDLDEGLADELIGADTLEERWDADDPRRKDDSFAPPTEPCECHCLHCGRTFSSEGIWFQKVINDPQGFDGFWMCPTPNCSGAGFTFDIFPTDPDHPANEGWHYDDDIDDEEFDDDDDDNQGDDLADGRAADALDGSDPDLDNDELEDADEYDPAEPLYKDMDEFFGDEDDDLEGEEWKYGLQPGERPPEPAWREDARREWEEDQKRYDEPDQRPRLLDWSDREDRKDENYHLPLDGKFSDDDIPF